MLSTALAGENGFDSALATPEGLKKSARRPAHATIVRADKAKRWRFGFNIARIPGAP
jgi:hypothetical protein